VLRSPLAVRVANSSFDRHITNQIADIEYSTAAPGGFDTCSFDLAKAITDPPAELAVESQIVVYDTRNGRTVWEGRLTDPGRSYSDQGHRWSFTAMGPKKHASDRFSPYIAIDTDLSGWRQTLSPVAEASATVSTVPTVEDTPCLLLQYPRGIAVAGGDLITMRYDLIGATGQKIGAFRYTHQEGTTIAAAWAIRGGTRDGTTVTIVRDQDYDTSVRTVGAIYAGDTVGTSEEQALIRAVRTGGATNVATDNIWAAVTSLYVIALMKDRTGANITGAGSYPLGYLTADLIVTDLIARFCPLYDLANATIDVTTYQIDQFAYPTAARPSDMLDDLALFHPDKRFCAWETNPQTSKYQVEWTGWGAQPRYEATIDGGIDLPGSSTDLYNQVTVQGLDQRGRKQSLAITSVVKQFPAGFIREAEPIDLGAELFTVANATRIGNQFLTANNTPAASGTVTITQPVRDLISGRMIDKHEIRAGSTMRLRGLAPTPGGITAADRDGQSVFRLVNTSFRDSDAATVCTLDSPAYTIEQLLARLAKRRQRH
jgi:hypothetical protein